MKFISSVTLFCALFALALAQEEGSEGWSEGEGSSSTKREFWASYFEFSTRDPNPYNRLLIKDIDPKITDNLILSYVDTQFSDQFVPSFNSPTQRQEFVNGVKRLKSKNRRLSAYIDLYIKFNANFVNSIRANGVSFATVSKNIAKFVYDLKVTDGLLIRTDFNINVEPQVVDEFFKELSASLHNRKLKLIGYVSPFDDAAASAFKYLHRIFMNDYSINVLRDNKIRHMTGLYRRLDDTYLESLLNKDFASDYLLSLGAPRDKFIFMILGGGYIYEKVDQRLNAIGAPKKEQDEQGYDIYSHLAQICNYLKQPSWTYRFDEEQKVPYAYNNTHWVPYDNIESAIYKVEMLKKKGLRGALLDSLDFDDSRGKACGSGKNPIAQAIKKHL